MLSRRLIRIKAFKVLYAAESSGEPDLAANEKFLMQSCEQTLELYYFLLNLAPALRNLAAEKLEIGKNKFNPTEAEKEANPKFVENKFVELLESSPVFLKKCENGKLGWAEYDVFVKKLYASVVSSDYYQAYMANPGRSFKEDCKLFISIYENELEDDEMLENLLEEKSIMWVDDLGFVLNEIISAIRTVAKTESLPEVKVFKNEDDEQFARHLLKQSLLHYDEYNSIVEKSVPNWDPDRIVASDAILVAMGLAEAVHFPTIPVKVTINEYVEISKYYSTPGSRQFVNGLLDSLIRKFQDEGTVVKEGRGLYQGETK